MTYANTSQNPNTADRLINITVADDLNVDSNTAVVTVHVVSVNDAPVNTVPGPIQRNARP